MYILLDNVYCLWHVTYLCQTLLYCIYTCTYTCQYLCVYIGTWSKHIVMFVYVAEFPQALSMILQMN